MKIAIIGCGYVGIALASQLQNDGHEITVTTRSPSKATALAKQTARICILQGNDVNALVDLLQDQDAAILCLAADNQAAYESTYLDTAKALAKAVEHTPKLAQIVYTGSTSVYGEHHGAVVSEDTPLSPAHASGRILAATESQLLQLATPQRHVCVLRLGEIYGPERHLGERLRSLNGCALPGSGQNLTNLIHLEDIVGAIVFTLKHRLSGVYNLCNDLHVTRQSLYADICRKEGLPQVIWNAAAPSMHGGNKSVSNAKLKAAGYAFMHPNPMKD